MLKTEAVVHPAAAAPTANGAGTERADRAVGGSGGERRPREVGGPVPVAWKEGTLTRAKELESLSVWLSRGVTLTRPADDMLDAIDHHLAAARDAAVEGRGWFRRPLTGPRLERAMSNLDAAEADLLQVAPNEYVLGQIPSLLNLVQRHLPIHDARRQEFERVAARLGCQDHTAPASAPAEKRSHDDELKIIDTERNKIVSIVRGAMSGALREQLRVRSFRTVIVATTVVMVLLAGCLALLGLADPRAMPLCFQPEQAGQQVVVCPTGQSKAVTVISGAATQPLVDAEMYRTARPVDLLVIEFIGLLAASIAAAAAIRGIRGSSEPHGLPVALALLKMPTGALTAVLGLLLMRGGFVPGLSALDSSAQILAWAAIFGYAQQLFTRFIDQQANSVLNEVRSSRTAAT
jgi:hypothetical protein